jgi:cytoskeletal protein RodZ
MTRDAFGPNLRRIRLQRGITIEQIAERTNIAEDLLEGLERNDFGEWPTGIFARAYVRQYAYAIGVDPDATVDEFCREFPQGDRRVEAVLREQAEMVGHALAWRDDGEEKRRAGETTDPTAAGPAVANSSIFSRLRRVMLAFR